MSSRSEPRPPHAVPSPEGPLPSRRALREARAAAERVGAPTVVTTGDPFAMVVMPQPPVPAERLRRRAVPATVGAPAAPVVASPLAAPPLAAPFLAPPAAPVTGPVAVPNPSPAGPMTATSPVALMGPAAPLATPRRRDLRVSPLPVPAPLGDGPAHDAHDAHGSVDTGEVAPVGEWLTPAADRPAAATDADADAPPPRPRFGLHHRDVVAQVRSAPVGRWLPQAGVIAVMAAATVGNSLAGPFQPTAPQQDAESAFVPTRDGVLIDVAAPDQPVASDLEVASDVVAGPDGLLRAAAAQDPSRSESRTPLPGCSGVPPEYALSNGEVPDSYLCELPVGGHRLRADAAIAYMLLNEAYAARFGQDMCLTSSYRTYAQQVAVKRQKGWLAAQPGTSEHGYGLAVDLCGGVESGGEAYWWLRENAPAFGWDNPTWARPEGSKTELWHWEYVAGQW
ncbi:MAG: D-alanyl-D-alanine carboxypeptidase family protein [Kineosporiaceae bacterium]